MLHSLTKATTQSNSLKIALPFITQTLYYLRHSINSIKVNQQQNLRKIRHVKHIKSTQVYV